jgi:thiamine pyrophosphate-dependent acetolactate synthase large subunit-like protein
MEYRWCHLASAIAACRQGREGKIVLFEGDGGLLFHIQELETLKRQLHRHHGTRSDW